MKDIIHELYDRHAYPAVSHPITDPAMTAVAARLGGLTTPHPAHARILEIGCSSGHNLIPLAMRWPGSHCVGIDLVELAIDQAKSRAAEAGVDNISFYAVDLRDFQSDDGPFDYIIAHGFLSWVPDEVKRILMEFCRKNLTPKGIASVSYNVECGWLPRFAVVQKVRAIQAAVGVGLVEALEILDNVSEPNSPDLSIIHNMLEKGEWMLQFDDFGPVNDPWSLDRFIGAAVESGLRWIGDSNPGETISSSLEKNVVDELLRRSDDNASFYIAADEAAQMTFRSGLLCRDDAALDERIRTGLVAEFSIGQGKQPNREDASTIWKLLSADDQACVPFIELLEKLPDMDAREIEKVVFEGIRRKWFLPRMEPVSFGSQPPEFPKLDSFRQLCVREGLLLVDARHRPCLFPEKQRQILMLMDGTKSLSDLAKYAGSEYPEIDFLPWIKQLTRCGMFS
jgi:2-polyprenyl-3-methyl-5-hydroxy-6-metoxy-1,4-benzoquinol methylase